MSPYSPKIKTFLSHQREKKHMIITVDTKHDSPEDIRKIIAMLQNFLGDRELMSNAPLGQSSEEQAAPFANIFQDMPAEQGASEPSSIILPEQAAQEAKPSSDELFSDLFSEEDVPKQAEGKEDEEDSPSRKPKIEFY